jgi:uncharacterized protein YndB with AHSA1/START domain
MNALKIILGSALFLGIIVFLLGLFVAPEGFYVKRTTTINAPASTVFPYVSSLKAMDAWSPWSEKDPNMVNEYEGTDGTVGAVNSWSSDVEEVGVGSQKITKIEPNKSIHTHLSFKKPHESESDATVRLTEVDGKTTVTWGLRGSYGSVERLFMMFVDIEGNIGPEFQKGLDKLKTQVEQDNVISASKDKMPANAN